MTKYLNGHCDVVMGIAVLKDKTLRDRLAYYQNALGGIPSPFDCYMVLRGIRTLHLRMERHGQNAIRVARYLESSPHVTKVIYSGLESHPQHELAKRQQRGFGGMISMVLKGNQEDAVRFAQSMKLFTLAESLGGVESLIEIPSIMTHGSVSSEERTHLGITDSFIRLSIGLEYVEDLIADLEQAFQIVFSQQKE
jgi:cystathionine gamma-lyase